MPMPMARPSPIMWRRKSCCCAMARSKAAPCEDKFTGARFDIRARTVLVAAGPWADLFLEQATGEAAAHKLIRSKGIHLLVPEISRAALTIEAGSGHLFALPWRGHTLLATTDTPFTGDPATVAVTENDIEDFLATFRKYLPQAGLDARQGRILLCRTAAAGQRRVQGQLQCQPPLRTGGSWQGRQPGRAVLGAGRQMDHLARPGRKNHRCAGRASWDKQDRALRHGHHRPARRTLRPFRGDGEGLCRKPGPAFPPCATWPTCWARGCRKR